MLSVRGVVKALLDDVLMVSICSGNMKITKNARVSRSFATGLQAKRVRPVAIRSNNSRTSENNKFVGLEHGDVNVDEIRADFRKELKHEFKVKGDIAETDLGALGNDSFDQAQRENERMRSKFRQSKMYRKHFREFLGEKEVSVLTYGEKEKIRYLYSTNPEEWTAESLSEAFPVSPDGVLKLVKSSFRAKSIQEIQAHDQLVKERIEKIKRGDIEMTPDLEKKMKMREQIPFSVGSVDPYDKNMLLKLQPVKFIGEFQRLVARSKPDTTTRAVSLLSPNEAISPSSQRGGLGQTEPDLGDFFKLESTPNSEKELRKLKISLRRFMTFDEFKDKMKMGGGAKSRNQEIQHLAKLENNPKITPTTLSDFEKDGGIPIENRIINRETIQKFQSSENNVSEDEVERKQMKTRDRLKNENDSERISVPIRPMKQDAIYQQGNSFYDETGEFLYKVV